MDGEEKRARTLPWGTPMRSLAEREPSSRDRKEQPETGRKLEECAS